MSSSKGLPGFRSRNKPERKFISNSEDLKQLIDALRRIGGETIVMTIGTWDMIHIGHLRYLFAASEHGDRLIVGVDSDRAVRLYKGPTRPIIPEEERVEMLTYQHCIDYVTLVDDVDEQGKWQFGLVKAIRPEIFVAVEGSYPEEQCAALRELCGELVVLPRQAEKTSSSQILQRIKQGTELLKVEEHMTAAFDQLKKFLGK
jgi:D-beta-D-heptose 7-phosphate kinase/D-beta-D-heptose 1-phosphate adenosyltransferase